MSPILGIYASQISGHLWPASSYESIATTTVGAGGASSVTFSSIPSTYTHLQIRGIARETSGTEVENIKVNFNSDTTANYSFHLLYGTGGAAFGYGASSTSYMLLGSVIPTTASANIFGPSVIDILDYTNTNKYKTVKALGGGDINSTSSAQIALYSGNWRSTSAITSVSIAAQTGNFAQYSSFALYGIKVAA